MKLVPLCHHDFSIHTKSTLMNGEVTMKRLVIAIFGLMTILFLNACSQGKDDLSKSKYYELDWIELKPEGEEPIRQGSLEIVDDWFEDDYPQDGGTSDYYYGAPPQASSVGVVAELDGKHVRVPGFIVPIEFEANLITEFFLVPYFGACFHKPPPPPNQTVFVSSAEPVKFESIYDPVWIQGVIKTEQTGNDIATAAYTMDFHGIEPYVD